MLAVTRLNEIRKLIQQEKSVLVADLAASFDVTEETIRRDLKKLEDENVLIRVYGGAYSVDGVQNDVKVNLRQSILMEEKRAIAERCLPFVSNGDSIFLDSSTTAWNLAQALLNCTVTLVTNSLKIAQTVCTRSNINLVLIGGAYHSTSMSFLGPTAMKSLNNYYVDKSFVSCRSISLENGISDSNQEQAVIRSAAIERCNEAYLIADHTKFDSTSFYHIADFTRVRALITDYPASDEWRAYLSRSGCVLVDGSGR